jgi:hypothetical protein
VRQIGISGERSKRPNHELGRAIDLGLPVRHQKRSPPGIEKCAGEPRQSLRTGPVPGRRVAGREHHPVGIELELGGLARREKPIIERGRIIRQRENKCRFGIQFGELGDFTRKQTMGCEVDDAIVLEPSLLNAGLSCLRTKDDVSRLTEVTRLSSNCSV